MRLKAKNNLFIFLIFLFRKIFTLFLIFHHIYLIFRLNC